MPPKKISARRQFWSFSVVGFIGFLVDAGIVLALTHDGANVIVSQLIAFSIAVTVTWVGNRSWTFGSQFRRSGVLQEWSLYVSANTVGWLVNNGVYVALVTAVPEITHEPVWAVAVGSVAGLLFNFTASRRVVFR